MYIPVNNTASFCAPFIRRIIKKKEGNSELPRVAGIRGKVQNIRKSVGQNVGLFPADELKTGPEQKNGKIADLMCGNAVFPVGAHFD